ncbi:hypothetical protein VNO77_03195 [Canavalia gladiata]|uniref:Uncharacterized protein n=1 Tax=Canavalia gladiata TaxID=3824 RepID=A0AAN9MUA6_CANGL
MAQLWLNIGKWLKGTLVHGLFLLLPLSFRLLLLRACTYVSDWLAGPGRDFYGTYDLLLVSLAGRFTSPQTLLLICMNRQHGQTKSLVPFQRGLMVDSYNAKNPMKIYDHVIKDKERRGRHGSGCIGLRCPVNVDTTSTFRGCEVRTLDRRHRTRRAPPFEPCPRFGLHLKGGVNSQLSMVCITYDVERSIRHLMGFAWTAQALGTCAPRLAAALTSTPLRDAPAQSRREAWGVTLAHFQMLMDSNFLQFSYCSPKLTSGNIRPTESRRARLVWQGTKYTPMCYDGSMTHDQCETSLYSAQIYEESDGFRF